MVQSGLVDSQTVAASGPLDASGRIVDTNDGNTPRYWNAAAFNASGSQRTFRAFAVCE